MQKADETIQALGNEPPLIADGRSGPPDRREVSARWLSGTFLTGVTSSVLLGFALMAALDGRDLLATPAERASLVNLDAVNGAAEASKSDRLTASRTLDRGRDRRRMEVSTLIRTGEHDVVRTLPFIQARMQLAAGHTTSRNYPSFDPLEVFAEEGVTKATATTGLIYGARVESEVSLRTLDFPLDAEAFDESIGLTADEVEQVAEDGMVAVVEGLDDAASRAGGGRLHRLGHAHSVEVLDGERLVGGLYGIAIGRMFFAESMFSAASGGFSGSKSRIPWASMIARMRSSARPESRMSRAMPKPSPPRTSGSNSSMRPARRRDFWRRSLGASG